MKVKIKDLKPNPFRNIENYPIDEEKVKSLMHSINQTGFWDNIVARKNNGEIQIAYGHHRLEALKRIMSLDDSVNIPMKELDDSTMIRIMAHENDEDYRTLPIVVDATIKAVKEYLENNQMIVRSLLSSHSRTDMPIGARIISRFLGGSWDEKRINYSLERLNLIEEDIVDEKAVHSLGTDNVARSFVRAVKKTGEVTPEQQRKTAQKIVEGKLEKINEDAIRGSLLKEKFKKPEKKDDGQIKLRDFIEECTKDIGRLNQKLEELLKFKGGLKREIGKKSTAMCLFIVKVKTLLKYIEELRGLNDA